MSAKTYNYYDGNAALDMYNCADNVMYIEVRSSRNEYRNDRRRINAVEDCSSGRRNGIVSAISDCIEGDYVVNAPAAPTWLQTIGMTALFSSVMIGSAILSVL